MSTVAKRGAARRWWIWWLLLLCLLLSTSRLERQQQRLMAEEEERYYYSNDAVVTMNAPAAVDSGNDPPAGEEPVAAADPTFLRRQAERERGGDPSLFWAHLEDPLAASASAAGENYYYHANASVTPETVCRAAPGAGWEGGDGGYRLLAEKIRLQDEASSSSSSVGSVRLFCGVYTHDRMAPLARAAARTWGRHCDGFLAFSNATTGDNRRWTVRLQHDGPESYGNMWQKTRGILRYLRDHFLAAADDDRNSSYDWFHLSGDDAFVLVPNLKAFLASLHSNSNATTPQLAGQWIRQRNRPYCAGGPGYTFNRAALEQYFAHRLDETFAASAVAAHEDRLVSQALLSPPVSAVLIDTRDGRGEQRYHGTGPQQVYEGRSATTAADGANANGRRRRPDFHSRNLAFYETLPHPNASQSRGGTIPMWKPVVVEDDDDNSSNSNRTALRAAAAAVGPKHGLEAAAATSVAFHKIHHPAYMARLYAILRAGTCPADSPLERGRRHLTANGGRINNMQ